MNRSSINPIFLSSYSSVSKQFMLLYTFNINMEDIMMVLTQGKCLPQPLEDKPALHIWVSQNRLCSKCDKN